MLAFFLRHAESASNAEPGRDLPDARGDRLTERGHDQARRAAAELAELGADPLVVEPAARARETAAPIAERLGLEIEVVEDLRELRESDGYGELSAEEQRLRRWSNWMAEHGDDPALRAARGRIVRRPTASAPRGSRRRCSSSEAERVLAVSHGIFLRFFF